MPAESQPSTPPPERTALLSVDFEDWHQLVRRRMGAPDWQAAGPALPRQTEALLDLFDELGARATFFILGMSARAHPTLVEAIAARGHEIACHGDAHHPVHSLTPEQFAGDLREACTTIETLTGKRPVGYRAPAFSITNRAAWAFDVLADEGFLYDASQFQSFAVRDHVTPAHREPHQLEGSGLWEFPVAVCKLGPACVPVGGASYWTLAPTAAIVRGLEHAGPFAGLYLHPHELDPEPLDSGVAAALAAPRRARAALRTARRNAARRRAPDVLRAIAQRRHLLAYGEAHARLSHRIPARP